MKKGFVLTFSAILLVSILVLFAIYYNAKNQEEEAFILEQNSVLKAGFVADDIEADFNRVLRTKLDINRGDATTSITFIDSIGGDSNKLKLLDAEIMSEGILSTQTNSEILLNVDNLVDGQTEMIFSNGLQYDYSYSGDDFVQFYVPDGDSGITKLDLNIEIGASSTSVSPWIWKVNGDLIVNLNYVDENLNNSVLYSGKLLSNQDNEYTFTFSGGTFSIRVGTFDGNRGAIRLSESLPGSTEAEFWLKTVIPSPSDGFYAYYDAELNYSQADVNVHRKIRVASG